MPAAARHRTPRPSGASTNHHPARNSATLPPETATKWARPARRRSATSSSDNRLVSPMSRPSRRAAAARSGSSASPDCTRERSRLPALRWTGSTTSSTRRALASMLPAVGRPRTARATRRTRPSTSIVLPTTAAATRSKVKTTSGGPRQRRSSPSPTSADGRMTSLSPCSAGMASTTTSPRISTTPPGSHASAVAWVRTAPSTPDAMEAPRTATSNTFLRCAKTAGITGVTAHHPAWSPAIAPTQEAPAARTAPCSAGSGSRSLPRTPARVPLTGRRRHHAGPPTFLLRCPARREGPRAWQTARSHPDTQQCALRERGRHRGAARARSPRRC